MLGSVRLFVAWGQLDDYPQQVRKERQAIDKLLTRLPARGGHVIQDNLQKMKNKTASEICGLIVSVHAGLLRIQAQSHFRKE